MLKKKSCTRWERGISSHQVPTLVLAHAEIVLSQNLKATQQYKIMELGRQVEASISFLLPVNEAFASPLL